MIGKFADDRKKVSEVSAELEKEQEDCCGKVVLPRPPAKVSAFFSSECFERLWLDSIDWETKECEFYQFLNGNVWIRYR